MGCRRYTVLYLYVFLFISTWTELDWAGLGGRLFCFLLLASSSRTDGWICQALQDVLKKIVEYNERSIDIDRV